MLLTEWIALEIQESQDPHFPESKFITRLPRHEKVYQEADEADHDDPDHDDPVIDECKKKQSDSSGTRWRTEQMWVWWRSSRCPHSILKRSSASCLPCISCSGAQCTARSGKKKKTVTDRRKRKKEKGEVESKRCAHVYDREWQWSALRTWAWAMECEVWDNHNFGTNT